MSFLRLVQFRRERAFELAGRWNEEVLPAVVCENQVLKTMLTDLSQNILGELAQRVKIVSDRSHPDA